MIYLQGSDFDISINKDPVSFSLAIESNESNKWIDAMKDELKSMDKTMFGISFNCLKVLNESGVNGSIRQSTTQMAILNSINLDLLPRVTLKRVVSIIKRHFYLSQRKTH